MTVNRTRNLGYQTGIVELGSFNHWFHSWSSSHPFLTRNHPQPYLSALRLGVRLAQRDGLSGDDHGPRTLTAPGLALEESTEGVAWTARSLGCLVISRFRRFRLDFGTSFDYMARGSAFLLMARGHVDS